MTPSAIGRAALWLALAAWTIGFVAHPLDGIYTASSFLHLIGLPFHEAGHVLASPFGDLVTALGGSVAQVMVPLVCAGAFLWQTRDPFAAAVALWWAGQNLVDVAPYIADARALRLVLIGGRTGAEVYGHDWETILARLGWLHQDLDIARVVFGLGCLTMAWALVWGAVALWSRRPR